MNTSTKNIVAFVILSALLLASCKKSVKSVENPNEGDKRGAFTTKDSWYSPAPHSTVPSHQPIGNDHFHALDSLHTLKALSMLERKSIIPLSRKEAADLGVVLNPNTSLEPYLVRALYLNKETGAYFLSTSADTLFVSHGSLGKHAVPMTRDCLIVELPKEPHVLYIDVMMAE